MAGMHPVRLPKQLPVVLSPGEVARLIAAAGNLKHQTALSVAYATGLRASEVVAAGRLCSTQLYLVVPSPGSVFSSTAYSFVPVGAPDQLSGGEEPVPSQV